MHAVEDVHETSISSVPGASWIVHRPPSQRITPAPVVNWPTAVHAFAAGQLTAFMTSGLARPGRESTLHLWLCGQG